MDRNKGKAIVSVDKSTVLKRCMDDEWAQKVIGEYHVMGVEYNFRSNSFHFLIETDNLLPTEDGYPLPVFLAKPRLGNPPPFIVKDVAIEYLRKFRNQMVHVGSFSPEHIYELDRMITRFRDEGAGGESP